ncbi:MAG: trypsin-like peptidase domain-containing protein [Planctomycetes bacterium]|nr:trypsin-like peptidase domain-containing protein [Planctomycetota bacterium]
MLNVLPRPFGFRNTVLAAGAFLFLQFSGRSLAEEGGAQRPKFLKAAVRIRYEIAQGTAVITGHGTAFGVDLSRYGYEGAKYLLSAAHNVLDKNGQPYEALTIELEENARSVWSKCKVVAFDTDLDLCLIESTEAIPEIAPLAEADADPGTEVVLAGSPRGIPVKLYDGTLLKRFDSGSVRSSARITFDHGDSGGPFFSAQSGKVIGVAVAGVAKGSDLDHNLGLFVPVAGVRSFLDQHRATDARPAQPATPLRTDRIEKNPVPAVPAAMTKSSEPAGKAGEEKPAAPKPKADSPSTSGTEDGQDHKR